jgi:hypothetical protein
MLSPERSRTRFAANTRRLGRPAVAETAARNPKAAKASAAPSDNSLLHRRLPCSGNENSLFRKMQGIGRKLLKLLRDLTSVTPRSPKIGGNSDSSLMISLFAGKSRAASRVTTRGHGLRGFRGVGLRSIRHYESFRAGAAALGMRPTRFGRSDLIRATTSPQSPGAACR